MSCVDGSYGLRLEGSHAYDVVLLLLGQRPGMIESTEAEDRLQIEAYGKVVEWAPEGHLPLSRDVVVEDDRQRGSIAYFVPTGVVHLRFRSQEDILKVLTRRSYRLVNLGMLRSSGSCPALSSE